MAYETKIYFSFKTLFGRQHTTIEKEWYEEYPGTTFVHNKTLMTDDIPEIPPATDTEVVKVWNTLTLQEDLTVGGHKAWLAVDGSGNRLRHFIKPAFGQQYNVRIFDNNGTEIPTSDVAKPYFDYDNGILWFENTPNYSYPLCIKAYQYIGKFGAVAMSDDEEDSPLYKVKITCDDPAPDFIGAKLLNSIVYTQDYHIQLENDQADPGVLRFYGTDEQGNKGWQEGCLLGDHKVFVNECDTFADYLCGKISRSIIVNEDEFKLQLEGDEATPDPMYYYGTDSFGQKGWYSLICLLTGTSSDPGCYTPGDIYKVRIGANGYIDYLSPNYFEPSTVGHKPIETIDDDNVNQRLLWSSHKINNELLLKSDCGHRHSFDSLTDTPSCKLASKWLKVDDNGVNIEMVGEDILIDCLINNLISCDCCYGYMLKGYQIFFDGDDYHHYFCEKVCGSLIVTSNDPNVCGVLHLVNDKSDAEFDATEVMFYGYKEGQRGWFSFAEQVNVVQDDCISDSTTWSSLKIYNCFVSVYDILDNKSDCGHSHFFPELYDTPNDYNDTTCPFNPSNPSDISMYQRYLKSVTYDDNGTKKGKLVWTEMRFTDMLDTVDHIEAGKVLVGYYDNDYQMNRICFDDLQGKVSSYCGDPPDYLCAKIKDSIVLDGNKIHLQGDTANPGIRKFYGTDLSGCKGWFDMPDGYDEKVSIEESGQPNSYLCCSYFEYGSNSRIIPKQRIADETISSGLLWSSSKINDALHKIPFQQLCNVPDTLVANCWLKVSPTGDSIVFTDDPGTTVSADANDSCPGQLIDKVDNSTIVVNTTGHFMCVGNYSISGLKLTNNIDMSGRGFNSEYVCGATLNDSGYGTKDLWSAYRICTFAEEGAFDMRVRIKGDTVNRMLNDCYFWHEPDDGSNIGYIYHTFGKPTSVCFKGCFKTGIYPTNCHCNIPDYLNYLNYTAKYVEQNLFPEPDTIEKLNLIPTGGSPHGMYYVAADLCGGAPDNTKLPVFYNDDYYACFSVYLTADKGFSRADQGSLCVKFNGSDFTSINLCGLFDEDKRDVGQDVGDYNNQINEHVRFNYVNPMQGFPIHQLGNFTMKWDWIDGEDKRLGEGLFCLEYYHTTCKGLISSNTQYFFNFKPDFSYATCDVTCVSCHEYTSFDVGFSNVQPRYLSGISYYGRGTCLCPSFGVSHLFRKVYYDKPTSLHFCYIDVNDFDIAWNDPHSGSHNSPPQSNDFYSYANSCIDLGDSETTQIWVGGRACRPFTPIKYCVFDEYHNDVSYVLPYQCHDALYYCDKVLIFTKCINPTDDFEPFHNETYRLCIGSYNAIPASITGNWDSTCKLTLQDAQQYFSCLVYPQINFSDGWIPYQNDRDYSVFNDCVYYFRAFRDLLSPHSNGELWLGNIKECDIVLKKILIHLKIPTRTAWLSMNDPLIISSFTSNIEDTGIVTDIFEEADKTRIKWSIVNESTGYACNMYILRITLKPTYKNLYLTCLCENWKNLEY